jgi:hypothetical protein
MENNIFKKTLFTFELPSIPTKKIEDNNFITPLFPLRSISSGTYPSRQVYLSQPTSFIPMIFSTQSTHNSK